MTTIPLPFITALLLVILFLRIQLLHIQNKETERRNTKAEAIFIGVSCIALALVALRWGSHFAFPLFIQPAIAASIPSLLWLCLFSPGEKAPNALMRRRQLPFFHLLPSLFTLGAGLIQSRTTIPLIDIALVSIYFGYGATLIYRARHLQTPSPMWKRAPFIAGLYVLVSGAIDTVIALDIAFYRGNSAATIITAFHIVMLAILTLLIITHRTSPQAGLAAPPDQKPETPPATDDEHQLAKVLDDFIRTHTLYTDPSMTLQHLSRRMGIPLRRLSETINRVHGRNFSQVINEYRIEEAKRLLSQTDARITDIMLESGFQTKSNFNREFLRLTGVSPSVWRSQYPLQEQATASATPSEENH
ncbi:AraC family transcriptional regulator [Pectobacterium parmentieri]|uniref:AraC family transcriptional regulator n=1 Tax=Pectobacterium parmentieri TaxID=1905730 RepID=A0A0H3I7I8_PECPM|nr:helix-turn-helix domain-containing protein [Pectobacterium parmentieri]AFI91483.1 Transcriptional regulator, AraC/XylS family [Pectobacterium parmentieri]MBI0472481.1 AraC family transcriptional regulator [Pectobacterium parmentieri]MBI0495107.1 AraC family transcriptional regulator [Pectobacterium parmentieri]MBI0556442.1 AraC family transcriptional regulator [Pectobacterium parmentieri]MBI0569662.1 AraC family transcriptional regulator [Pectobacterium parmentieri]